MGRVHRFLKASVQQSQRVGATAAVYTSAILEYLTAEMLLCDPTDTEWFEGVERLASKLSSSGIPFEKDFDTRAGGHSWDYFNYQGPAVVQFLAERLEKERLRLPTPTTPVFRTVTPGLDGGE